MNPVTRFGVVFAEALARQWQALAVNSQSSEVVYGLRETHTVDSDMPHDAIRWGTQGQAISGNEVRILDAETGRECAIREAWEIVMCSACVFTGDLNNAKATAQTLCNCWVHTGTGNVLLCLLRDPA